MDSHSNKNRKRFMTSSLSLIAVLVLLCHSVLFFSHPAQAAGTIYYVNQAATGTGCASWADACPDLQTALAKATSGDEIWVTAGVYKPGTAVGSTFQLKSGVGIYGGFAGTETALTQRNWEGYITTLSGDLGNNSYSAHIVTVSGTNNTAILDGFTITKGRAKGDTTNPHGGAVYIKEGSPTLNNIIFIDNKAEYGTASFGGAIYCTGTGTPNLTNIVFEKNKAVNRGGGMYSKDSCNPVLTNITFKQNIAQWEGGGMFTYKNTATLNNITFIENELYATNNAFGAGLANSSSNVTLNNVTFIGNLALTSTNASGGGMYTERYRTENPSGFAGDPSNITLNNVSFINNQAKSRGGGMTTKDSAAIMTGVIFKGNKITASDSHGGAMMNDKTTNVKIQNGIFIGNQATNRGGAIYNTNSPLVTLSNVTFTDNKAKNGGAIYNTDSALVTLRHATFTNNVATEYGGGIYTIDTSPANLNTKTTLSHVEFTGNTVAKKGGGIYNKYAHTDIANAIFINNTAGWGGGLSNDESDDENNPPAGTKATITNALFHGNVSEGNIQFDAEGGGVFNGRVELTVRNVTFSNNTALSDVGTHKGRGGGLFVKWCYPNVSNSIFWGNQDSMGEGGTIETAQIRRRDPDPPTNSKDGVIINNSIIQEFSGSNYFASTNVVSSTPLFVDVADNNLRLQSGSPAIDAGNNDDVPPDILDLDGDSNTTEDTPWDLDGSLRANGTVDMGAYEYTTTTSAPTDITLSASSVNEHDLGGSTIGTLATTGGTASYTYDILAGNTDVFEISSSTLKLKAGMSLDYYEDLTYPDNAQHNGTFLGGSQYRLITIKSTDDNDKSVIKTFTITIKDKNEAPILHIAGNAKLPPIDQNITDANNTGIKVSQLIASVLPLDMITDLNNSLKGIAVVAADTSKGTWQYYKNSFDGWQDFGTVSKSSALLLPGGPAEENDWLIRFKPNGTSGTATFSFRAWDRSSGSSGSKVDTTTNGGSTAYSIAIETASINIISTAQYAPTVTNATTNEDAKTTNGLVIAPNSADTYVTHFKISAITGGTLYKSDGTTAIAEGGVITLAEGAAGLKFMPTANSTTNGSFNVYSATTEDGYGLSPSPATATITINPIADTPSVTNASTNEDTQTSTGLVLSRNAVDGNEITHFKITNITGGTLYKNDGTTAIANDAFITYDEGNAGLKFTPTANATANGSFTVYAAASNTGAGLSAASATATINVTSIADVPTVSVASGSLATQENVPLTGIIIERNTADGADVTHFKITDINGGTLKKINGDTISAGMFITYAEGKDGLTFTPTSNSVVDGSFTVYAATSDQDTGLSTEATKAIITINVPFTPTPTPDGSTLTPTPIIPTPTPDGSTLTPTPTKTATPGTTTATPGGTTATPGGTTATPSGTTATPGGTTATPSGTTATPSRTSVMPGGTTTATPSGTTAATPSGTTTATPGGPTLTPTPTPTPSRTPIKVSGTLKAQAVNIVSSTDEQFQSFLPPGGVRTTATFTAEETFIMPSNIPEGYIGVRHFTMGVTSEVGQAIIAFDEPLSVSIAYTPEELTALGIGDATSLYLAYFDEQTQQWVKLETTLDATDNLVMAKLDRPAEIVLLGEVTLMPTPTSVPTPTRTPSKLQATFETQSVVIVESPDKQIQVVMPPGGVSGTTIFTIEETFTMPPDLPTEYSGVRAFSMGAITADGEQLSSFDEPLMVSIAYTDDMLAALGITDESSLTIAYFDTQSQKQLYPLETTVKEADNRIVIVLERLSSIVLIGKVSATPTPTVTPTPDANPTMRPTIASPTETPIATPTADPSNLSTPTPNANANLKLTMSAPTTSVPGNVLYYDINCENIGDTTLQDVEIIMSAPDYTTFNANESSSGWTTAALSSDATLSASGRYVYPIGEMKPGATVDAIVFAVVVNDNFPIGFNLRANVTVQSSGSEPLQQESITYVGLNNVFLPLIAASRTSQPTNNPPTPIPTATPIGQSGANPTATAIPGVSPTPIAGMDLIVTNFSVSPSSPVAGSPARITIVVKNQGTQQTDGFWVDFYINPSSVPMRSGIPWNTACGTGLCQGIVWSVDKGLAPGASITLTSDSFESLYTSWGGTFDIRGTNNLYAYVDSWGGDNNVQGAVHEANETNNMSRLPITVR